MAAKFNPTLSFDGVAIITSVVACCLWIGGLSARVGHLEETTKEHGELLKALTESQKQTTINLAVLQQLVIDRDGRKQ